MAGRRRSELLVAADREVARLAAALGSEVRTTRRERHLAQEQLAAFVGVDRSCISKLERGLGGGAPLRLWVTLGSALDRRLSASLARDHQAAPADAGHLAVQELLHGSHAPRVVPGSSSWRRANPTRPEAATSSPATTERA